MSKFWDKLKACYRILRAHKYVYAVENSRHQCEYGGGIKLRKGLKPSARINASHYGKITLLNMAKRLPDALDSMMSITPPPPPKKNG